MAEKRHAVRVPPQVFDTLKALAAALSDELGYRVSLTQAVAIVIKEAADKRKPR